MNIYRIFEADKGMWNQASFNMTTIGTSQCDDLYRGDLTLQGFDKKLYSTITAIELLTAAIGEQYLSCSIKVHLGESRTLNFNK